MVPAANCNTCLLFFLLFILNLWPFSYKQPNVTLSNCSTCYYFKSMAIWLPAAKCNTCLLFYLLFILNLWTFGSSSQMYNTSLLFYLLFILNSFPLGYFFLKNKCYNLVNPKWNYRHCRILRSKLNFRTRLSNGRRSFCGHLHGHLAHFDNQLVGLCRK